MNGEETEHEQLIEREGKIRILVLIMIG